MQGAVPSSDDLLEHNFGRNVQQSLLNLRGAGRTLEVSQKNELQFSSLESIKFGPWLKEGYFLLATWPRSPQEEPIGSGRRGAQAGKPRPRVRGLRFAFAA